MPAYLGREREQEPEGAAGLEALVDFTKPWWFRSDFAPVQAPAMALPQPSGTPAKVPNARITGLFRRKEHKSCFGSWNPAPFSESSIVSCGELLVGNSNNTETFQPIQTIKQRDTVHAGNILESSDQHKKKVKKKLKSRTTDI